MPACPPLRDFIDKNLTVDADKKWVLKDKKHFLDIGGFNVDDSLGVGEKTSASCYYQRKGHDLTIYETNRDLFIYL